MTAAHFLFLLLYWPKTALESPIFAQINFVGVNITETHVVPEKTLLIVSLLINFSFTLINVSVIILYNCFFKLSSFVAIFLLYNEADNSLGRVFLINPLTL